MPALLVFILVFSSIAINAADIRISEAMSNNATTVFDNNYNTPDWIELYNCGTVPVNLKSYRISDKNSYKDAWILPDTILQPKSSIIVYASGKDTVVSDAWTVESSGWGIYHVSQYDSYRFDYLKFTGDFEISVEMSSVRPIYGKVPHAGLLVKEKLDDLSNFVALHYWNTSDNLYHLYTYRDKPLSQPKYAFPQFINPNKSAWLRMKRTGDSVYTYCEDSQAYIYESHAIYFPQMDVFAGIASASTDINQLGIFSFRNLKINNVDYNPEKLSVFEINTAIKGKRYKSVEMHTDFQLSDNGEKIFLWNPQGELIDEFLVPYLQPDVSAARVPDTSQSIKYVPKGTPAKENTTKNYYDGIAPTPVFTPDGGWFTSELSVAISNFDPTDKVFYSLDGSEPNDSSLLYTGESIKLVKNTVLRAKIYRDNFLPGNIRTRTFFINDSSALPVFSISAKPEKLKNSNGNGMFDLLFSDIRTPAGLEYFDSDKKLVFESRSEMRLFGHGAARAFGQPSIRLDERKFLGSQVFDYNFFGKNSLKEYETLRLRNSSGDWTQSFCRDILGCTLASRIPSQLSAKYQPVLSFINGSFFGLYNLREHIDEAYLSTKYNIPEDSINIMKNFVEVLSGSVNSFFKFFTELKNADLNTEAGVKLVESNLDIKNMLDYTILSLYVSNYDWPGNNILIWQSGSFDGRWRFVANDFDWSFNWDEYGSDPDNECIHTFLNIQDSGRTIFHTLVNKLLTNRTYSNYFINKSADLMNSVFMPEPVIKLIDSLKANIEPVVERQRQLRPDCLQLFEYSYKQMVWFATIRSKFYREDIVNEFALSGLTNIKIKTNNDEKVKIRVNSLISEGNEFEGIYFRDVPIEIEIIGGSDQNFAGWSEPGLPVSKKITLTLNDSIVLVANFIEESAIVPLVINEIMYKPSDSSDCKDWFEIYNPNKQDVALGGFTFKDDNDNHIFSFSDSCLIKSKSYLVVAQNPDEFKTVYGTDKNPLGPFDFGIGVNDQIRLFNQYGTIIDSVAFSNAVPWPINADGTGLSIELINPALDNNIGINWKAAFNKLGSPGNPNSNLNSIGEESISSDKLYINPNPSDDVFKIYYDFGRNTDFIISVFNMYGARVYQTENQNSAFCKETISLGSLSTGIYLLQINFGNEKLIGKLIKK